MKTTEEIGEWLTFRAARALQVEDHQIDRTIPLTSQGLDSLTLLELTGDLAHWLGRDLSIPLLWQHPTIDSLADYLANGEDGFNDPAGWSTPRDQALPLSFAQERIWRIAAPRAAEDRNIVEKTFHLRGPINVELLSRSLHEVIRRHEILRTTFDHQEGHPYQVIHPDALEGLQYIDASSHPSPDEEAVRLTRHETLQTMDLVRGPLTRMVLVKIHPDEYRLTLLFHHLLHDARSLEILSHEVSVIYAALAKGMPATLASLPLQVADFASWQRHWLRADGPEYQKQMEWWQAYWGPNIPPPAELPFRRWEPPDATTSGEGAQLHKLPASLLEDLHKLCTREGATMYMVLLTAFELVLSHLTQSDEHAIGTYVSDRRTASADSLIGFFVNLVALRLGTSQMETFLDTLARVRSTLVQVAGHQDLPFETLYAGFQAEGRPTPDVSILFNHVKIDVKLQLPGVLAVPLDPAPISERAWGLTLHVYETAEILAAYVTFDSSAYDPAGITRMLQLYGRLLEVIVAAPTQTNQVTLWQAEGDPFPVFA